jgi:hypothetical protein
MISSSYHAYKSTTAPFYTFIAVPTAMLPLTYSQYIQILMYTFTSSPFSVSTFSWQYYASTFTPVYYHNTIKPLSRVWLNPNLNRRLWLMGLLRSLSTRTKLDLVTAIVTPCSSHISLVRAFLPLKVLIFFDHPPGRFMYHIFLLCFNAYGFLGHRVTYFSFTLAFSTHYCYIEAPYNSPILPSLTQQWEPLLFLFPLRWLGFTHRVACLIFL